MKYVIILKEPIAAEIEAHLEPKGYHDSLHHKAAANAIMEDEGFISYIAKNGYHFTDSLSQLASDMMINSNGKPHTWSPTLIKEQLILNGYDNIYDMTLGDITYLANMAYADFYPRLMHSEHDCIVYAISVALDEDGYDGIAFSRWLADIILKNVTSIDWSKFIN